MKMKIFALIEYAYNGENYTIFQDLDEARELFSQRCEYGYSHQVCLIETSIGVNFTRRNSHGDGYQIIENFEREKEFKNCQYCGSKMSKVCMCQIKLKN